VGLDLSLLYRGPLASCTYRCAYCPFAKRVDGPGELELDRAALGRFLGWIASRPATDRLRVFFTPWGEGLVRSWYQEALVTLSHLPQLVKVAIQTNLGCSLDWLDRCDPSRVGLWATYHPGEVERERFLTKVERARAFGVSLSVGMVGLRSLFGEIQAVRRALSDDIYLWINAVKNPWGEGRPPEAYTAEDLRFLERIDPLFRYNLAPHPSRGLSCSTGRDVVSVDGDGAVRRCHFVRENLGNLYRDRIEDLLRDRPCPNDACGCHIGYVHLEPLGLRQVFGEGLLERALARGGTGR